MSAEYKALVLSTDAARRERLCVGIGGHRKFCNVCKFQITPDVEADSARISISDISGTNRCVNCFRDFNALQVLWAERANTHDYMMCPLYCSDDSHIYWAKQKLSGGVIRAECWLCNNETHMEAEMA